MNSWRDNTSQQAQKDLDELFSKSLDAATNLLKKSKNLYPFAITLSKEDKVALETVYPDKDIPDSQSAILKLKSILRSENNDFKAVAIIFDVSIDQCKNDAIRILVEHHEGIAMEIDTPYIIHGMFKKKIKLGTINVAPIDQFVWISE